MTNQERKERRQMKAERRMHEAEIKRDALVSALESGKLTASEKVQVVMMLNELKAW